MSNRQATYTIKLNNQVIQSLEQTEKAALRVDGVMGELNRTMSMFGLAFGAGYVINLGKEWVHTAADYEQSMMRIKNASENAMEGLKNQFFIKDLVDRLKIDLDRAVEDYGSFLFKIKNANLGKDKENRLFEQLASVSKVAGLSTTELQSTTRNIAILLGEGVLEARHLRALSYSHPQLIPFLADELGLKDNQRDQFSNLLKHSEQQAEEESKLQKFSQMISSGSLTKLGLPADLILGAMDRYYNSIKDKIPETLTLVNASINDLENSWLNFKQNLVLGDKPEVVGFINSLNDGVKYLTEHSSEISKLAGDIGNLIKLYAGWRIGLMALQAPFGIVGFFRNETQRLTSTFGLYIPKVNEAALANEKLAATQTQLIVDNEAYVASQTLATEADMRRFLGIEELNIAINQNTASQAVQMEMFTESTVGRVGGEQSLNMKLRILEEERIAQSQFANQELLAIEESFIAKKEAILLADRHKYGYNVFQQKTQYNAEVAALNQQMIIDQQRVKSELIYIETEYQAKVAELRQAGFMQQQVLGAKQLLLFEEVTVAGVEANTKIASAAKIAADEAAAAWTASAAESEAAWIATSAAISGLPINMGAVAASARTSAGALVGRTAGLLSSAIMPVFIAGMAAQVGLMFLGKGKVSGDEIGFREFLEDWGGLKTYLSLGTLETHSERIRKENEKLDKLSAGYDKMGNLMSFNNYMYSGKAGLAKLKPEGHELLDMLSVYPEFLNKLNPVDKYGKILETNVELYDVIKRVIPNLPFLIDSGDVTAGAPTTSKKDSKSATDLAKATTRLRGNSVTNIHISWTGGMNGMTNPVFKVNNMADMKEIEETVGTILVKKLTDAVNDAQYLH